MIASALEIQFQKESQDYFVHYPFMAHALTDDYALDGNSILYAGSYGLLYSKLFDKYPLAPAHSELLYADCSPEPGIICRGPSKWNDPETHDDYVGLATMSSLSEGKHAAEKFYDYGSKHFWCFFRTGHNNLKEWFNSCFFRMPGLVGHLKMAAGKTMNAWDRLWWASSVFWDALMPPNHASGKILTWHYVNVYRNSGLKYSLCDKAANFWQKKLSDNYPNLMGDVFKLYYSENHLFAKWGVGVK